jgi:DNA-binding response OmpR family regulator
MSNIRKKIMIVDDDDTILQTGKELLGDSYDVFPLPSAGKMFLALNKVIPDLFLLDINMPDMDGFEIIMRLKADARYAKIPVIFATGTFTVEKEMEGLGLGAVDFLTKPFKNPDFIERIKKHLNYEKVGKPVILAVDDSPDILKMIYTILHDTYKVYTLPQPRRLKEFLQNITPDLFLLDYRMPSVTGLNLIPMIRDFPRHVDTPIIFLTSDDRADIVTAAVSAGVCDYILKPFNNEALRQKIAQHIATGR